MYSCRYKYIFLFKSIYRDKLYINGLDSFISGNTLFILSSILLVQPPKFVIVIKCIGLLSFE